MGIADAYGADSNYYTVRAAAMVAIGLLAANCGGDRSPSVRGVVTVSSIGSPELPHPDPEHVAPKPQTYLTDAEIQIAQQVLSRDGFVTKILGTVGQDAVPYETVRAFLSSDEVLSPETPARMVMMRIRSSAPLTIPAHPVPLFDVGSIKSASGLGYDVWNSPGVITNAYGLQIYVDLATSQVVGVMGIDDPLAVHGTETFPDGYQIPAEVSSRMAAIGD